MHKSYVKMYTWNCVIRIPDESRGIYMVPHLSHRKELDEVHHNVWR